MARFEPGVKLSREPTVQRVRPPASREAQFLAAANRRIAAYSTAMRDLRAGVHFLIEANERLLAGQVLSEHDAGRLRTVALKLFDAETILYG